MDQLTIGDELRDRGMHAATAAAPSDIIKWVDAAIYVCRERYPLFTSDHVRNYLELQYGCSPDNIGRVIGARMNAAGRRREITATGMTTKSTRPEAHSRRLLIWRRA